MDDWGSWKDETVPNPLIGVRKPSRQASGISTDSQPGSAQATDNWELLLNDTQAQTASGKAAKAVSAVGSTPILDKPKHQHASKPALQAASAVPGAAAVSEAAAHKTYAKEIQPPTQLDTVNRSSPAVRPANASLTAPRRSAPATKRPSKLSAVKLNPQATKHEAGHVPTSTKDSTQDTASTPAGVVSVDSAHSAQPSTSTAHGPVSSFRQPAGKGVTSPASDLSSSSSSAAAAVAKPAVAAAPALPRSATLQGQPHQKPVLRNQMGPAPLERPAFSKSAKRQPATPSANVCKQPVTSSAASSVRVHGASTIAMVPLTRPAVGLRDAKPLTAPAGATARSAMTNSPATSSQLPAVPSLRDHVTIPTLSGTSVADTGSGEHQASGESMLCCLALGTAPNIVSGIASEVITSSVCRLNRCQAFEQVTCLQPLHPLCMARQC